MLKQFTKQKIESELSLFDKTNDPPPIHWPTLTTGHHPGDAASQDERTPPRTGTSCPWCHRPPLPRFLSSWISVFGQKVHFTLLSLVWERMSPRESVWPALSSHSLLSPSSHHCHTTTVVSVPQPGDKWREKSGSSPSIPSTSLGALPVQMVIKGPNMIVDVWCYNNLRWSCFSFSRW